ncbi:MAG: hypothetical protein ABSH14_14575 [Verrucomicrobiia bacterium]
MEHATRVEPTDLTSTFFYFKEPGRSYHNRTTPSSSNAENHAAESRANYRAKR